jgi:hypothetical protein
MRRKDFPDIALTIEMRIYNLPFMGFLKENILRV